MSKSYHQLVREQAGIPLELPDKDTAAQEELKFREEIKLEQLRQWNRETVSVELFRSISQQIDELEQKARELACQYHLNQNHQEIISLLVRSTELRKLKKTYARSH